MKTAFVVFNGMTMLDFVGVYDPLTRLKSMGFLPDFEWDICSLSETVKDDFGLELLPSAVNVPLATFDLVVVAGGYSTRELMHDKEFLFWLRSAKDVPLIASVCTGSLLLGAAGFLRDKRATTHPNAFCDLSKYCGKVVEDRIVDEGNVITAGGVASSLDLGLHIVNRVAAEGTRNRIAEQMAYAKA